MQDVFKHNSASIIFREPFTDIPPKKLRFEILKRWKEGKDIYSLTIAVCEVDIKTEEITSYWNIRPSNGKYKPGEHIDRTLLYINMFRKYSAGKPYDWIVNFDRQIVKYGLDDISLPALRENIAFCYDQYCGPLVGDWICEQELFECDYWKLINTWNILVMLYSDKPGLYEEEKSIMILMRELSLLKNELIQEKKKYARKSGTFNVVLLERICC